MIRIFALLFASALILTACYSGPVGTPVNQGGPATAQPGVGRYVYPQYQRPEPTLFVPQRDNCNAVLYQGLTGQHIGGVQIATIPGDKRIIQPADEGLDRDNFLADMEAEPPLLRVTEMLAGQPLYAASVRTGLYAGQLGPDRQNRLTIELDQDGYVQNLACR